MDKVGKVYKSSSLALLLELGVDVEAVKPVDIHDQAEERVAMQWMTHELESSKKDSTRINSENLFLDDVGEQVKTDIRNAAVLTTTPSTATIGVATIDPASVATETENLAYVETAFAQKLIETMNSGVREKPMMKWQAQQLEASRKRFQSVESTAESESRAPADKLIGEIKTDILESEVLIRDPQYFIDEDDARDPLYFSSEIPTEDVLFTTTEIPTEDVAFTTTEIPTEDVVFTTTEIPTEDQVYFPSEITTEDEMYTPTEITDDEMFTLPQITTEEPLSVATKIATLDAAVVAAEKLSMTDPRSVEQICPENFVTLQEYIHEQ